MISTKLIDDLRPHLKEAKEVWIAVALMKDNAFNSLQSLIPPEARQHFLVGIDLPTTPSVLEKLQSKQSENFKAAIYKHSYTYHPKVYLIKKEKELVAFVGSANATQGGFSNNIEISNYVNDQGSCNELLKWFNDLYRYSTEISPSLIEKYKLLYRKNQYWRSIERSNQNAILSKLSISQSNRLRVSSEQFFRQSDFYAFEPVLHTDTSQQAKALRKKVRDRLLYLNELIFPKFKDFGIDDLYLPSNSRNYTSQYFHSRGSNAPKDAIWLNYGKSTTQLSKSQDKSFTNNIRVQIILRNNAYEAYIGFWLFIGKPNCSIEDRKYLKEKANDHQFLYLLFNLLTTLGGSYWIKNGDENIDISDLNNFQQLKNFLVADNFLDYYIIGRNYQPNEEDLSEENIVETTLIEFSKLFHIYDLIRVK